MGAERVPTATTALRWDHTSLAVGDLDAAIRFYGEAFGYDPVFVERGMAGQIASIAGIPGLRCDLAQLRSPISGHTLELIAFRQVAEGYEGHGPTRPGEAHVAFVVADLDAALERLRALGAEPIGAITDFESGRCVYCREPSGTVFELEEMQPEGSQ